MRLELYQAETARIAAEQSALLALAKQRLVDGLTLEFDASKPDGTPRKLMDVGRMNAMGWKATADMRSGLATAYQDFLARA